MIFFGLKNASSFSFFFLNFRSRKQFCSAEIDLNRGAAQNGMMPASTWGICGDVPAAEFLSQNELSTPALGHWLYRNPASSITGKEIRVIHITERRKERSLLLSCRVQIAQLDDMRGSGARPVLRYAECKQHNAKQRKQRAEPSGTSAFPSRNIIYISQQWKCRASGKLASQYVWQALRPDIERQEKWKRKIGSDWNAPITFK